MSNLFDLSGKVAVVTGASSGLGVQFAKALAKQGADLALVARRVDRLNDVKAEIEALGVRCISVKCDVSKSDEITAAVNEIKDFYGTVDILVNNAGLGLAAPAESQDDELWETMMAVNVNGLFYFAREVGKIMLEKEYGRIINIGSIHSTVAMNVNTITAYATTKGAVEMFTKSLAVEWAKKGITVNAIGPAYFPSEMTDEILANEEFAQVVNAYCPMGRTGRDGELDGALIYFASDASSYTTGQLLTIDGGWTAI